MKMAKIILVVVVLGAIALYYSTQLGTHKESIEYYGGRN